MKQKTGGTVQRNLTGKLRRSDHGGGKCRRHNRIIIWPRPPLDPRLDPHKYSNGVIHSNGLFITSDDSRLIKIYKTWCVLPSITPSIGPRWSREEREEMAEVDCLGVV
jgi:hypothetical protein